MNSVSKSLKATTVVTS